MFLMVCTMKDSNTLLTFCLFLIPHILPLTRYNVATSRYETHYICCPSFQFTTAYGGEWYLYCPCFLSPFSPICSVQDYIYSKYRMQLTQLNNNTHLKNLASNQNVEAGLEILNSFFFSLYARKRIRIFCLIIAWKNADIWHEIQGITCDLINLWFFKLKY